MPETTTYSVDQAAAAIGVTRRCIDRWIYANADESGRRSHLDVGGVQVPALRVGARWRVPAAPLDAALRGEAVAS